MGSRLVNRPVEPSVTHAEIKGDKGLGVHGSEVLPLVGWGHRRVAAEVRDGKRRRGPCPHPELGRESKKGARKGLGAPAASLGLLAKHLPAGLTADAVCSWRAALAAN